jgi:ribonuclease HI
MERKSEDQAAHVAVLEAMLAWTERELANRSATAEQITNTRAEVEALTAAIELMKKQGKAATDDRQTQEEAARQGYRFP